MQASDPYLIQETLAGNPQSFGILVRRYQGAVHGLAYHLVGSFEDAQDIAQDVFVTAYLKLSQLKHTERFAAWVRQITWNHCRMAWRGQQEHVPIEDAASEVEQSRHVPTPADEVERQQMQALVHRALQQLSDKNRLVFTLYHLNGLSYHEIASFLDVPMTTVEGRMHRARKQLQGRLTPMIEQTLHGEQLSDSFAQDVVEKALNRAKEARKTWSRDPFLISCDQAIRAAEDLTDKQAQSKAKMEALALLGQAQSTWLGDPEKAMAHYELGVRLAHDTGDQAQQADFTENLAMAACRQGDFAALQRYAADAFRLFGELGEGEKQGLMQAAQDLATMLPERWEPGQAGGYVMACFPLTSTDTGTSFLETKPVRFYSWGCPSRCTALAHLLGPMRILGSELHVGATWQDTVTQADGLGIRWHFSSQTELIASSEVESTDARVLTPAGTFTHCLRVRTDIRPVCQPTAAEFAERSWCGTRTAWFAPGVGLLKLHHEDQNSTVWGIWLTEHDGVTGDSYLPMEHGAMWRYQWASSVEYLHATFEDVCRVVAVDGETAYLSSATIGLEPPKSEIAAFFESMLPYEAGCQESAAEAALLARLAYLAQDDDTKRLRLEQLITSYGKLGRERQRHDAQWQLKAVDHELAPSEKIQRDTEKLALTRQTGERFWEGWALNALGCDYEDSGDMSQAMEHLQKAADIFVELGDAGSAAMCAARAERDGEMRRWPESETRRYRYGDGAIRETDGKLYGSNSSRCSDGYPPGDVKGSPMSDLFFNGVFAGIKLFGAEVGTTCTSGGGIGVPWGTDSVRGLSKLVSKSERISVAAGDFANCVLIESTISASSELGGEGSERNFYRDYWCGIRKVWFAPGVGFIKVAYEHRNGYETHIELVDFSIVEPTDVYLPLAVDNRWRYRWTDQASGIQFEEVLRVVVHRGTEWNLAFATRAELPPA